jgi:hypothetical protein
MTDSAAHRPTYRDEPGFGRDYNQWTGRFEASDRDEQADERADEDEDSGYNWGPPPDPNLIPDPGFSEGDYDQRVAEAFKVLRPFGPFGTLRA